MPDHRRWGAPDVEVVGRSGEFDSYPIEAFHLKRLRHHSSEARNELRRLVDIYQDPNQTERNDCLLKLARLGHKIYELIFTSTSPAAPLIKDWFEDANQRNEIASLELVINA
jgi:hypothetical protein